MRKCECPYCGEAMDAQDERYDEDEQEEVMGATLILVWVCVVAAIGTFMLAMLREKIMDQGVWMLWGVFIGGIGVAGAMLLLEATK